MVAWGAAAARRRGYQLVRKWPSSECPAAEAALEKVFASRGMNDMERLHSVVLGRVFAFLRTEEPMFRMYHPWPAPLFVHEICARVPRQAWAGTPAWVVRVDVIPGKANLTEKQTRWMVLPLPWSDIKQFLVRWALNDFTTENMILREDSLDTRYKSTYTVQAVYPPPFMRPAWSSSMEIQKRSQLNDAISSQALELMWSELLVKAGVTATKKPFKSLVKLASRRRGGQSPRTSRHMRRAARRRQRRSAAPEIKRDSPQAAAARRRRGGRAGRDWLSPARGAVARVHRPPAHGVHPRARLGAGLQHRHVRIKRPRPHGAAHRRARRVHLGQQYD